mgnify:CR=1 FL=1
MRSTRVLTARVRREPPKRPAGRTARASSICGGRAGSPRISPQTRGKTTSATQLRFARVDPGDGAPLMSVPLNGLLGRGGSRTAVGPATNKLSPNLWAKFEDPVGVWIRHRSLALTFAAKDMCPTTQDSPRDQRPASDSWSYVLDVLSYGADEHLAPLSTDRHTRPNQENQLSHLGRIQSPRQRRG